MRKWLEVKAKYISKHHLPSCPCFIGSASLLCSSTISCPKEHLGMPGYGHFASLLLTIPSPHALPCALWALHGLHGNLLQCLEHLLACFLTLLTLLLLAVSPLSLCNVFSLSFLCYHWGAAILAPGPALPCGGTGRARPWPRLTGEPRGPLTTSLIALSGLYRNCYFWQREIALWGLLT